MQLAVMERELAYTGAAFTDHGQPGNTLSIPLVSAKSRSTDLGG
jgi:hypothetical protein